MILIKVLPGRQRQLYVHKPTVSLLKEISSLFPGRGPIQAMFRWLFSRRPHIVLKLMNYFSRKILVSKDDLEYAPLHGSFVLFVPNNGDKKIYIYEVEKVVLYRKCFGSSDKLKFQNEIEGLLHFRKYWNVPEVLESDTSNYSLLMSRVAIDLSKENALLITRNLYSNRHVFDSDQIAKQTRHDLLRMCEQNEIQIPIKTIDKFLNFRFCPIHGDAAYWNISYNEGKIVAIDFEDFNLKGVFGYDSIKYAVTYERFVLGRKPNEIQKILQTKYDFIDDITHLLVYFCITEIEKSSTIQEESWYRLLLKNTLK